MSNLYENEEIFKKVKELFQNTYKEERINFYQIYLQALQNSLNDKFKDQIYFYYEKNHLRFDIKDDEYDIFFINETLYIVERDNYYQFKEKKISQADYCKKCISIISELQLEVVIKDILDKGHQVFIDNEKELLDKAYKRLDEYKNN